MFGRLFKKKKADGLLKNEVESEARRSENPPGPSSSLMFLPAEDRLQALRKYFNEKIIEYINQRSSSAPGLSIAEKVRRSRNGDTVKAAENLKSFIGAANNEDGIFGMIDLAKDLELKSFLMQAWRDRPGASSVPEVK